MKAQPMVLNLIIAASLIKTAAGLHCPGDCAACWKTGGAAGEDIKFACIFGNCGGQCPGGYENLHCAKSERCQYVGFSRSEDQCFID
jgi:hypothetical protein